MRAWPVEVALLATGRWKGSLEQRFGLAIPPVQPGSIWIHAASLGETQVARRLSQHLGPAFCTADTAAGLAGADGARPLDHPWTLAPLWAEARPSLLVFIEGSWWPALVRCARRSKVPIVVVGARLHPKRHLMHHVMGWPDAVFARDQEAADAYQPHCPVLGVSGLLKGFSAPTTSMNLPPGAVIGGCTHAGEEVALVRAWRALCPSRTLVLAPRDLSRVPSLLRLFPEAQLRSGLADAAPDQGSLIVLDTLGELGGLYRGASAAFIGGTFNPTIGGHSPMEARCVGVPVFHGPAIANNAVDFVDTVQIESLQNMEVGLRQALRAKPSVPADPMIAVATSLMALRRPSEQRAPRPWARGLVFAHRIKMRVRSKVLFDTRVWAVGSRNARGAGKTALADFVARGLAARGLCVGIVTRGIGACVPGGDSDQHGADPAYLGDEGALLALYGHRVVAARWREGVEKLADCDVVLLEDGLQAGLAARSIEVVDARFPEARGAFPLGEDRGLLRPSDAVVFVQVAPEGRVDSGSLRGVFVPSEWSGVREAKAVGFAGIGRPVDFFSTIELEDTRSFPDHHLYNRRDRMELLRWAAGRQLLTTTRDALRLPSRFPVIHRTVRMEVEGFPWDRLLESPPVEGP